MDKMKVEHEYLIAQGQRLKGGSSDIRATEIQCKLEKLDDNWTKLADMVNARLASEKHFF